MKRIEQYLQKLSDNVVNSKTTISQYYNIGTFTIRYSDHVVFPAQVDLQIIFPTASFCDYYAVFYRETTKPMILNAKQISNMLSVLITISQLETITRPPTVISNTDKFIYPIHLIQSPDIDFHSSSTPWDIKSINKLQGIISKLYNTSKGFSVFKLFLIKTPCTCTEAITIFHAVRMINDITSPTEALYNDVLNHIKTLSK